MTTLHAFSREDLQAIAEGLDGYEKTVNVGNTTGTGDTLLESTTAAAARFIRNALDAAEPGVAIDFNQATKLLDMFGGQQSEITLTHGDGYGGRGLYAHFTEYAEDGSWFLGATDQHTPAAQAPKSTTLAGADEDAGLDSYEIDGRSD